MFFTCHAEQVCEFVSGWQARRPVDTFVLHPLLGQNVDDDHLSVFCEENIVLGHTYLQNMTSSYFLGDHLRKKLLNFEALTGDKPGTEWVNLILSSKAPFDGGLGFLAGLLGFEQINLVDNHPQDGVLAQYVEEIFADRKIMTALKRLKVAVEMENMLFGPGKPQWISHQYNHLSNCLSRGQQQLSPSDLRLYTSGKLPHMLSPGSGGGVSAVLQLLGVKAQSTVEISAHWRTNTGYLPVFASKDSRNSTWQNLDLIIVVDTQLSDIPLPYGMTAQVLSWARHEAVITPIIGIYEDTPLSRRQILEMGMDNVYLRSQRSERDWKTWGKKLASTWSR